MPPSIFRGQLRLSEPRYATLADHLRLKHPQAARLRKIVDSWVAKDPPAARAKIRTDLLSPRTSEGTFAELVLREVLRRKFGSVEPQPQGLPIGKRTPDFAVRVGRAHRQVVFDSTTVPEKIDPLLHRRRDIIRRLDRISGPWLLIPEWSRSTALETIRPSILEAKLRKVIAGLPHVEHGLAIPVGKAVFRARLEPFPHPLRRIVAIDNSRPAVFSPGVSSIKKDIQTKTNRYRELKAASIPFVLAVGSGVTGIDTDALFTALYGNERFTIKFNRAGEVTGVEPAGLDLSGAMTPNRNGKPRYRTLSAAWLIRWLLQGDDLFADVVHFPNPWATNPIRIPGRDIARVRFRRINDLQVTLFVPRKRRLLKIS